MAPDPLNLYIKIYINLKSTIYKQLIIKVMLYVIFLKFKNIVIIILYIKMIYNTYNKKIILITKNKIVINNNILKYYYQ